jgi:hypothetical protein
MARYAAHVLQLEPPSARFNGTNPKSKNEIPSPNVSASKTASNRRTGTARRWARGRRVREARSPCLVRDQETFWSMDRGAL